MTFWALGDFISSKGTKIAEQWGDWIPRDATKTEGGLRKQLLWVREGLGAKRAKSLTESVGRVWAWRVGEGERSEQGGCPRRGNDF